MRWKLSSRRAFFLLGWVPLVIWAPLAQAQRGPHAPPPPAREAGVTEKERRADEALLGAIRSGRATVKEIESYTDRLFERDGEKPSEPTRERLETLLEAALAVESYRRSKVVWHQWGAFLFDGVYYDTALGAFGRALELDPGFFPSLLSAGTAYVAKGRAGRALLPLLEAVRAAPGERAAWFYLAQALIGLRSPSPRQPPARARETLAAYALLQFEALSRGPLPAPFREWKEEHRESFPEARRLSPGQFAEGVRALVRPFQEALARARRDGVTFRGAQRFEELRAEYLARIERRIRPRMGRYFGGLVYDPDRYRLVRSLRKSISRLPWRDDRDRVQSFIRGAKERGTGAIVITLEEELGSGRRSPIYVLGQMFETPSIPSEEDLISALVNHERVHVDQVGEGIRLRSGRRIDAQNASSYHEVDLKIPGRPPVRTVQVAQEVVAYANEIRQFLAGKAGVTPLYIRSAVENFGLFYGLLERIASSGVAPDDLFARELADEVRDVAEALRTTFPAPEKPGPLGRGERVYVENCAFCHGLRGDGRGFAAHMLETKPRDFTSGLFKFRSTPPGAPPRDEDLLRVLTEGIRGTGMVSQRDLPEADLRAVVAYIKGFSNRFQGGPAGPPVPIGGAPPAKEDLLRMGKGLFQEAGCGKCHGKDARGDGPLAGDLVDDWGAPIRPSDLRRRPLKASNTPEALYRTIVTGVEGTPMPSYGDSISEKEVWALVRYLESLVPEAEWANLSAPTLEERRGLIILQHHRGTDLERLRLFEGRRGKSRE